MEKSQQESISSEEHHHVHYHYYYPDFMRKSQGEVSQRESSVGRQKEMYATPRAKVGRVKTQEDQVQVRTQVKKMKMSDIGNNQRTSYYSTNVSDKFITKAKSVVEEEYQSCEEESEFNDRNSFLKKSAHTNQGTESHLLVQAHYESEMAKLKAQIERLKMIQEECVYLRDAFYGHYTQQCPKYT